MNHKLLLAALLTAAITAMSEGSDYTSSSQDTLSHEALLRKWLAEENWKEILKPSIGPCHGATNVKKCCQWKEDSTAVKRTEKENDRLETLRHCCYSVDCEGRSKKLHK